MDTSTISHAHSFVCDQKLLDEAKQKLHTVFGYNDFVGQQRAIMEQILAGGDALLVLPAGSGKSVSYRTLSLVMSGVTLVISGDNGATNYPENASAHIKTAHFDPDATPAFTSSLRRDLENGLVNLLHVSAEDFSSAEFLALLGGVRVALIVVDDAHCAAAWPFDLRLEYTTLSLVKERFAQTPLLAVSRVADAANRHEVLERLKIRKAKVFTAPLDRPNIRYQVSDTTEGRVMLLQYVTERRANYSGIVFCTTKAKCDDVAAWLCGNGRKALTFHPGLGQQELNERRERFLNEEGVILVGTSGNRLKVNNSNVRFVVHLDLPGSLDCYYRETSLAGRDGLPAEAWLVYDTLCALERRKSLTNDHSTREFGKQSQIQKLDALMGFCEGLQCRRSVLLRYFGEKAEFGPSGCGNCDHCLSPSPRWDGTQAARKALATVHLTHQRFGMLHLIEVLVGRKTATAARHGHENLKVFGCGKEFTRKVWQSIFRQLLANGYLKPGATGFGALRYTEKGLAVLKAEEKVFFRGDTKISRAPKPFTRPIPSRFDPQREHLFQALKERRSALARAGRVPDNAVLTDAILAEIVRQKPRTNIDLLRIPGINEKKVARYGQEILEILDSFGGRERMMDLSLRD